MPLIIGCSRHAISKNIARLRREGYSAKQASAIAYRIAREHRRMCKKTGHLRKTEKRRRRKKSKWF